MLLRLSAAPYQPCARDGLRITRVAHAAVLIQWGNETLLTDPWFSEKPLYHPGEKLAMTIGALPQLSAVLTSMNHYDHFDIAAFSAYRDHDVSIIVIAGSKQRDLANRAGFRDIRALAAWESVHIGSSQIHAIPANPTASPADFVYEQAYVIKVDGYLILFCARIS